MLTIFFANYLHFQFKSIVKPVGKKIISIMKCTVLIRLVKRYVSLKIIEVSQSSLSFMLQVMPSMISLENLQIPGDIDGGRNFQIN